MSELKLSEVQCRVMKWLGGGWTSAPGAGMAIHVNGQRVCNVDTMHALARHGLVEQLDGPGPGGKLVGQWRATENGRELARQLSSQNQTAGKG